MRLQSPDQNSPNRSDIKEGDTAVIWGGGRVGQAIMQAARTKTAAPIFVVDVSDNRLNIAKDAHADIIPINPKKEDPPEAIQEQTNGRGVDVAFDAVGNEGTHLERRQNCNIASESGRI